MANEKSSVNYQIDADVASKLETMSKNTKREVSDLVETALKFFIATHSDYLSQSFGGGPPSLAKK